MLVSAFDGERDSSRKRESHNGRLIGGVPEIVRIVDIFRVGEIRQRDPHLSALYCRFMAFRTGEEAEHDDDRARPATGYEPFLTSWHRALPVGTVRPLITLSALHEYATRESFGSH